MGKTKSVQLSDEWHTVLSKYVATEKLDGNDDVKITTTVEQALANYTPLEKFAKEANLL